MAKDAGEKGVPVKAHTWGDYATKHSYQERFRKEEKARWDAYSKEREERQQHVLDKVAGTFELVFDFFAETATEQIELLKHEDEHERDMARFRMLKMFGSMEAVDKFYRMYLRARGQPEKITKQEHSGQIVTTYGDLDDKPKASGPVEARRLAEKQHGEA